MLPFPIKSRPPSRLVWLLALDEGIWKKVGWGSEQCIRTRMRRQANPKWLEIQKEDQYLQIQDAVTGEALWLGWISEYENEHPRRAYPQLTEEEQQRPVQPRDVMSLEQLFARQMA